MTTFGPNAFVAASGRLGLRPDPYPAFDFLVEIEGLVVGGFSEVTGLQVETVVEPYREGGVNEYEHRLAGPTRYPSNLVLRHGITDVDSLWAWHQDVCTGVVERRNGTVHLLDSARQPVMWWDFREACPVRWTGPELRAETNTVAVETVELVHRGIRMSRPGPVADGTSPSADDGPS
ncbi:phage tail protein [Streptomyces sp. NRRL F-5755]|uniref:phage tail protein n=1 Tax=Streptomyces sp. NRRL F-5755 TaxID=1519475 RepID=UPI0006AE0256|nr:phage tail protein [Streptomyces sp. NRRL F-5755]KOU08795.1 phage tail protein [Streptomyces sp. NRRL F-5755]